MPEFNDVTYNELRSDYVDWAVTTTDRCGVFGLGFVHTLLYGA